jgi:hypothetical protein
LIDTRQHQQDDPTEKDLLEGIKDHHMDGLDLTRNA